MRAQNQEPKPEDAPVDFIIHNIHTQTQITEHRAQTRATAPVCPARCRHDNIKTKREAPTEKEKRASRSEKKKQNKAMHAR